MEETQQTLDSNQIYDGMRALYDYLSFLHLRRASRGILPNFDTETEAQTVTQKISALTFDDFNIDMALIHKVVELLMQLSLKNCTVLMLQRIDTFKNHEAYKDQVNPASNHHFVGDCEPIKKRFKSSSKSAR